MGDDHRQGVAGRRIAFADLDWTATGPGARSKQSAAAGQRLRILELTPDLVHPDWCAKGHAGFVVEGEFELTFETEVVRYGVGDGFIIPSGEGDRHIPRALTPSVRLLLFEEEG